MRFAFLFLVSCFAVSALAAEFDLLAGDRVLSAAEMEDMTARHLLEFYEGGQSRYSAGGAYSYTYEGGGTAFGQYEIGPEGTICITFRNGRDRCDQFVRSHGRLVMITQSGDRFPIRP